MVAFMRQKDHVGVFWHVLACLKEAQDLSNVDRSGDVDLGINEQPDSAELADGVVFCIAAAQQPVALSLINVSAELADGVVFCIAAVQQPVALSLINVSAAIADKWPLRNTTFQQAGLEDISMAIADSFLPAHRSCHIFSPESIGTAPLKLDTYRWSAQSPTQRPLLETKLAISGLSPVASNLQSRPGSAATRAATLSDLVSRSVQVNLSDALPLLTRTFFTPQQCSCSPIKFEQELKQSSSLLYTQVQKNSTVQQLTLHFSVLLLRLGGMQDTQVVADSLSTKLMLQHLDVAAHRQLAIDTCDADLVVDGVQLPVHVATLSLWSSVLSECITSTGLEPTASNHAQLPLPDRLQDVAALLTIMYSIPSGSHISQIELMLVKDRKGLLSAILLADKYCMPGLLQHIDSALSSQSKRDPKKLWNSVNDAFAWAKALGETHMPALKHACTKYIAKSGTETELAAAASTASTACMLSIMKHLLHQMPLPSRAPSVNEVIFARLQKKCLAICNQVTCLPQAQPLHLS
ncbi:hypothetical protein MMC29_003690 [Sticta canariensis]|nr:hypothetical protein [Sticta canariensis]